MTRDVVRIRQLGNCLVITLPKELLGETGFQDRQRLLLTAEGGRFVAEPADRNGQAAVERAKVI